MQPVFSCLFVFCIVASRGFKILNVGAPRTGTQTIYTALETLGYNSLHSGYQITSRDVACDYIFENGSWTPLKALLDNYDAAMDEPFQLLFKEVMQNYPEAKMILPLADPEHWYENYLKFYETMKPAFDVADAAAALDAIIHPVGASLLQRTALKKKTSKLSGQDQICTLAQYWGCDFKIPQTAELKARCIGGFNQHIAEVKAQVPPEKLLLFNLTDGWGPLVKFLGVPEPTVPFPHEDRYKSHTSLAEKSEDESLVSWMKTK